MALEGLKSGSKITSFLFYLFPCYCSQYSLLKVADDDGQREGHGEGSADGSEGAHKLAQPGDWEDVSIPE